MGGFGGILWISMEIGLRNRMNNDLSGTQGMCWRCLASISYLVHQPVERAGMTKYKIFLALYTRRMSCLGPILVQAPLFLEREELPCCQDGGMGNNVLLGRSIRRVVSGSVLICKEAPTLCSKSCRGLSAPCKIRSTKKKGRGRGLPKIPETYSSI